VANATDIVKKGVVRVTDEFRKESSATLSAATRFYVHAMVGRTTGGYLAKFDDSQSMIFVGVVRGDQGNPRLPAGTAGDGTIDLDYQQPKAFEIALTSVAVTDIGKPVYALDDQTATLTYSSTTYANLIGTVVGVAGTSIALVKPAYDGVADNLKFRASKRLSATGAQTLSKWDAGKTIFCANTAALALTLPAISDVPVGTPITIVKDHASDTNAITVTRAGSDTFEGGGTTYTALDAPYDVTELIHNGTLWIHKARDVA